MTNAKDKLEKQEELKSCPVAAALAPVRQLQKGEQVSALIFEGGGTKGAAYAGVVKALDAAGLVKDVKHFAGASAGAMTAAILAAGHDGPALAKFIKEAPWEKLMKSISYLKVVGLASKFALKSGGSAIQTFLEEKVFTSDHFKELAEKEGWTAKIKPEQDWGRITLGELADYRGVHLKIAVIEATTGVWKLIDHETEKDPVTGKGRYADMPVAVATRASMAFPIIFTPVEFEKDGVKELFVDGGFIASAGNMPVRAFVDASLSGRTLCCDLISTAQYADLLRVHGATSECEAAAAQYKKFLAEKKQQKQEVKENKISGPFAFVGFLKALLGTMMTVNSQSIGVASKLREAKLDDDQCQSLAVKLPKDTDVIMIDVGDAVSFDDNLEAVEITAMEARGREAVKRYLEYDLPAEVSARNANY